MRTLRSLLALPAAATMLIASVSLHAQTFTAQDRAALPEYCKYVRFGENLKDEAKYQHYMALTHGMFQHMHHWCTGLMWVNRARLSKLEPTQRKFAWAQAEAEINYILAHNPQQDWVMLPEILYRYGEALLQQNKVDKGTAALLRAMELRPDYWPPYLVMSDYLLSLKDVARAREWLEKGLAAAPDSKTLRSRLADLKSARSEAQAGDAAPPKVKDPATTAKPKPPAVDDAATK